MKLKTSHSRRKAAAPRARQMLAAEITEDCLQTIHRCFYQEDKSGVFFRDKPALLKMVVFWPAKWLSNRGVSLPGERYRDIVCEVVRQAAAHHTARIQYPPGFLCKSLQSHFKVHGEAYYEEGKSARNVAEAVLANLSTLAKAAPDPIKVMVETRDLLRSKKPAKPTVKTNQLSLL